MASGIEHQRAALITAAGVSVCAIALTAVVGPVSLVMAPAAYAAVIVEPDLDHHAITRSERTLLRWNRIAGWLWLAYWWPYEKLMPHRSKWSHVPFMSTAIRLLYVAWLPIVLWPSPAWLWAWLGMSLVDCVHYIMDGRRVY